MRKSSQTQQKRIERITAHKAWFDKNFYLGSILNMLSTIWFSVILGVFSLSKARIKAPLVAISIVIIILCGVFNIVFDPQ